MTSHTQNADAAPMPAGVWLVPLVALVLGYATRASLTVSGAMMLLGVALFLGILRMRAQPVRKALSIWSLTFVTFGLGAVAHACVEYAAVQSEAEDRAAITQGESKIRAAFPSWTGASVEEGQALLWSGRDTLFVLTYGGLRGDGSYDGTLLAKSAGGRYFLLDARASRKDSPVVFSNLRPITPAAAIQTLLSADRREMLERFALPQAPA